jgi:ActR/RegA family two-component response regulator
MKDILLVDDDRRILDTVVSVWAARDWTFETASCCEEAISAPQSGFPSGDD